ncbi:MAG: 2,3-bisphosphoglycerate-dependent phosphoglycerate mutase [Solirubrobacteraceae bacterium]|nr:2,3-bisphosphoglycerate-dependent phosphoglycerate mutase [Solirubrobacteraceae bacterium]
MIWLARHGETAYNAERRFQGQGAVPLSERGREQARELAEQAAAHDFTSLWASPLPRALETAEIVGARLGLEIAEDPRLMETDAGDWTDRPFAEVEAAEPERFAGFVAGAPDFAFPGGESFAAQQDRVTAALADIRAAGPLPALVVCHRNSIRLALERAQGRRLSLDDVPNGALVAL